MFFQNERLYVHLNDEREISVPLHWFPRLLQATEEQRQGWELMGQGQGDSLGIDRRRHFCRGFARAAQRLTDKLTLIPWRTVICPFDKK